MEFTRASDQKRLRFILNSLKHHIKPGAAVLDIGCGNGIITRSIGAHGFNVLGIDSSEKTIQAARRFNKLPNVHFDVIDAEELLKTPDRYEAVVCSEVLEHLHEPAQLLYKIHKLMNDDGILVVTVPNGIGPREVFVTKPVQKMQRRQSGLSVIIKRIKFFLGYTGQTVQSSAEDLTHIQFFTRKELDRLAKQTGFEIVQFRKLNFVEQVFPFSLITNKSRKLQRVDIKLADWLPYFFSSGFMMIWKKSV